MDLQAQMSTFVFSCVFGLLMGLVFDLLTFTARMFKHKKIALYIFDSVYCVVCFVGAVLFLLIEGTGRLESYILFGAVLGAVLYFVSISAPIKRIIAKKPAAKCKK